MKLHADTKGLALNPDSTVEIHGHSCPERNAEWNLCECEEKPGDARAVDPADGAMSRTNMLDALCLSEIAAIE